MRQQQSDFKNIDWITIFLYLGLVTLGWLNIYAAVYDVATQQSIFSLTLSSGRQLYWITFSCFVAICILVIDAQFYNTFSYITYLLIIAALIIVLLLGRKIGGATSWIALGPVRIQPAEFAKFATALAMAKFLSATTQLANKYSIYLGALVIVACPALLIIAQRDTGTALVFAAFVFVLYREGLPSIYLILGFTAVALFVTSLFLSDIVLYGIIIGVGIIAVFWVKRDVKNLLVLGVAIALALAFTTSVKYIIDEFLQEHQKKRIAILINPDADPLGAGYQVRQSKIAIGSGGFWGKGFLQGTQTKFDFVPDQSTDFIFCTIGEEQGWLGSVAIITLFVCLIFRTIILAERQKSRFSRAYGYAVASIFLFHFMINIGMTIGVFPVIGIPLPFFSYGGSSLLGFTILLFILIKLDSYRWQLLSRGR